MAAAQILYVGAVVIQASDPMELARWYSEKFGMATNFHHEDGYYGSFDTSSGPFHFAIVPRESGGGGSPNISITFRVNNYTAYLKELAKRGLEPIAARLENAGRFATFQDPEGNQVGIWGG